MYKKGFFQHERMNYKENCKLKEGIKDDIMIGLYYEDGGTAGEFCIEWEEDSIQLRSYYDSWKALNECDDVIEQLSNYNEKLVTPYEISKTLINLGYEDLSDIKLEQISL